MSQRRVLVRAFHFLITRLTRPSTARANMQGGVLVIGQGGGSSPRGQARVSYSRDWY